MISQRAAFTLSWVNMMLAMILVIAISAIYQNEKQFPMWVLWYLVISGFIFSGFVVVGTCRMIKASLKDIKRLQDELRIEREKNDALAQEKDTKK